MRLFRSTTEIHNSVLYLVSAAAQRTAEPTGENRTTFHLIGKQDEETLFMLIETTEMIGELNKQTDLGPTCGG
jgi:hypothetical protein